MKITNQINVKEQQVVENLLAEKVEKSVIEKSSVFIAKHKNEIIGAAVIEIERDTALLHCLSIKKSYHDTKYPQKTMQNLSIKIAFMGVRNLYGLTENEDLFYYNSHFKLVDERKLPDNYRSHYLNKFTCCKPRIFYKHLPNPWPNNPFR